MAAHVGWRDFWWLYVAMLGSSIIMIIFMYPETQYHRGHIFANATTPTKNGKISPPSEKESGSDTKREDSNDYLEHTPTAQRDPYLGRGRPSRAQWGIYTPHPEPFKAILLNLWTPIKLYVRLTHLRKGWWRSVPQLQVDLSSLSARRPRRRCSSPSCKRRRPRSKLC